MFHLGWFLGDSTGIHQWWGPWSSTNATDWMKPDIYVDLATSLERGGFDLMFIEDTAMVEDTYGGSMEMSLKYGEMVPKNDPMLYMPLMAQATKHLGLVGTVSTIQYPPYLAARQAVSMDHVTKGRSGINVVTSVSHRVAQNFGYDQHLAHAERYAMANEWMDVVSALWESWDPDAVLMDKTEPRFADHTKVHTIDFEGTYFKVRGPLNTMPGPQRRPVVAQAGNSTPGRELAAAHADCMLALCKNPDEMRALRQDMDARLIAHGRKPGDLKILFMTIPVVAETDEDARELQRRAEAARHDQSAIDMRLWAMSYASGGTIDYGKFDLDGPVPQEIGTGETTTAKAWLENSEDMTLRDLVTGPFNYGMDFVGSYDTVAEQMGEAMDAAGGDGFLIYKPVTRKHIIEITDGLCPALQERGLIRTRYEHPTFRENLLAF
ncbi:NtaA/DmoA family FMN-dependent monooxygenase [Nocardioides bruguierae]|uniref:NtaA/DmoA family FMN-dependent monooxygenase n=1 Tax=Nocardioides bruguierae TaxID=2945102 RepID=A0A9X2D6S7_9ACTN|nr:NtaA/DmoA family FMN-dependent monooxygenase [Nocardioides bruguierae]MCM0619892.1 NtaA/DmoA family FMN-dependent monooxygenase [Nocardioides bruguierae]